MTDTEKTKTPKKPLDLETLFLKSGAHNRRADGVCLMEAVAWIAGEKHSDHPECTDRALSAFGRSLNDRLTDDERQLLKPIVPLLVGTRGSLDLTRRRAFLLVDRQLRVITPAFLRGLPHKPRADVAAKFEGLPLIVDGESARRARDLAREWRDEVRASLSPRAYAYAAAAAAAYAYAYAYAAAYAYAYAAAAADAAAYAYAAAAAYAAADAYAAAYAAAYAYAAAAADAAAAFKALRRKTIELSIQSFRDAIALTETSE